MGWIARSVLVVCLIKHISANSSPVISNIIERLREDLPIGAHAFNIIATDADNDVLSYSLAGPDAAYFNVNPATGEVFIKLQLDREREMVLSPIAAVSDDSYMSQKEITVVVLDANDNKPIFQESAYNVAVPENTAVGTRLFTVSATDADTGLASLVKYSIDEVMPADGVGLFSIAESKGDVILSGNLNYTALRTFYRLKINASDGGEEYMGEIVVQSNIAFAFITVVDIPDIDPQFLGLPYTTSVKEGSPLDTVVFRVTAIDPDTEINDEIIYSIQPSPGSAVDGLFAISGKDGIISVKSAIDREVLDNDVLTLIVKATEAHPNIHGALASTTAEVQITILDVNDNKPIFYKCGDTCVTESIFSGEIDEHSFGTIPINMTVKDIDKGAQIKLILQGAYKEVFSVSLASSTPENNVQFAVKNPQKLDYEDKALMVVEVIAIDGEIDTFRSTATVTIKVIDTNDNSPTFPEDAYKVDVPEHSPAGKIIASITAKDPDTMDEGKITYRLLPDSILKYFDVEADTGKVYVRNSTLIDREVNSLYTMTLQARDTNNNTGTTVLEIMLTDINDQPPVINRETYMVFVREGEYFKLQIQATDADDPQTQNSQIVFGIMPSKYSENFTIDPNTGVLRNNGPLDREVLDPDLEGKIELNVTATDKGFPSKSTMATVIISIEDINDNTPKFKKASYKFSVKEGEKGAFVGSVEAEDSDQTEVFNRISFSIVEGSFGNFIIRTYAAGDGGYRGNITVDPDVKLDYESLHKKFSLWVEAANLDKEKALVLVEIVVLDVNDERPEFKPTKTIKVKENTTIAGPIGRFTAEDKDGNHSLVYELESMECHCNSTLKPCNWFILEPTGEITVNPEVTIDYELCDQALIEAQVVDENTQKGENNSVASGEMIINIEDINDNAPEFIASGSVFVVVSETASKGTSVAGVTATDCDSGINEQIDFEVKAVQFHDTDNRTSNMGTIFEAVTTQQKDVYVGIIQPRDKLDTSLKGKYLITVAATDAGGLSTSTMLEVFTVDESFKIQLRFASPLDKVLEDYNDIVRALTTATKAAVQVVATRPDTGESRKPGDTIMEAYFVYANGTAITSDAVERMLSDPEHFVMLSQFGLTYIGTGGVDVPKSNLVIYILLGVVAGLIILLTVLIVSLVCTRRSYKTKMRAANAMKMATMVGTENQKNGPVVPGTNKYTMEGANPVLNLNIDTSTDLGFDEESPNSDKVSVSSLDYDIDMTISERDRAPMMIIQEEDEEDFQPGYIEPLGAALAQRGKKQDSSNSKLAFSNPAFSTTDL
ncbi:cadherin-related family member 2 [Lampris incognitus]|uniref:cadherin-related family member 2 n=1 Tax=Lampris incognitus TaxID=2546036 RepID=UPI0024B491AC|nr:cadherin-related family member 2 [Lampris incognitus]